MGYLLHNNIVLKSRKRKVRIVVRDDIKSSGMSKLMLRDVQLNSK